MLHPTALVNILHTPDEPLLSLLWRESETLKSRRIKQTKKLNSALTSSIRGLWMVCTCRNQILLKKRAHKFIVIMICAQCQKNFSNGWDTCRRCMYFCMVWCCVLIIILFYQRNFLSFLFIWLKFRDSPKYLSCLLYTIHGMVVYQRWPLIATEFLYSLHSNKSPSAQGIYYIHELWVIFVVLYKKIALALSHLSYLKSKINKTN